MFAPSLIELAKGVDFGIDTKGFLGCLPPILKKTAAHRSCCTGSSEPLLSNSPLGPCNKIKKAPGFGKILVGDLGQCFDGERVNTRGTFPALVLENDRAVP